MKHNNKIFIPFIIFYFFSFCWGSSDKNCFAQNKKIDSLQNFLKTAKEDTLKVNSLNLLAQQYINVGTYSRGDTLTQQAMKLAERLNFKKGIADSYSTLGGSLSYQGRNYDALKNYFTSLKIRKELGDKKGISNSCSNIGSEYQDQGDYPEALDYYFKSLKIKEELGKEGDIAKMLNTIGFLYDAQADHSKALDYYFKALKISGDIKDMQLQASTYNYIGIAYAYQAEINPTLSQKELLLNKALDSYFQSLKIAEELKDKNEIAKTLGNIGGVYAEQAIVISPKAHLNSAEQTIKKGLQSKAIDCFFKALKLDEELGNESDIGVWLSNIGLVYTRIGKFKEAGFYLKRAVALDGSLGVLDGLRQDEEALSQLYDTIKQYKLANIHYKKAMMLKDKIFNRENEKQFVRKEMKYEFDKETDKLNAENEKQQAIAEEKNRKQKFIIWSVAAGLLLVLSFSVFVFRSLRIARKQKQIIEIKNAETEFQKKIIQEKNKDITDSIFYAKQIQDALLGEEEHMSKHLPEHFILFMPKDIVSGDFYWNAEKQQYWYFATADCTGHGVPGAIMSMLCISFLNDIVLSEDLLSPSEILNRLRDKVVKELRQTGESGGNRDGMDISLVRLNLVTKEIQWAGANNVLNFIRNGNIEKIKADKQPIGYHPESHPFTNHEIQLQKGDTIYIYSDGYSDQFGGAKGKKFTYKQLENVIVSNNQVPMNDQKELLKKQFMEWKGSLEQVDDVCVFGVRV
jgi:serine phosphatase RsbU (regulator of sigma subunit)